LTLGELVIKISCDSSAAQKGIEETGKKASKLSTISTTVANGVKKIGKVAAAAVGTATVAIGKITTSAVKAYANYEQLTGGVETLFGTSGKSLKEYQKEIGITEKSTKKAVDNSIKKYNSLVKAQNKVMTNARNAFKTTGQSMNDYLETVTTLSTALIKSMADDTEAAADVADMAMRDMSDNANKMGTDMEAIQNAYKGFAKQNYTMLDNLKLGYGGTRKEMQRLLKDAQKITGIKYDINNLKDVYEAIHVIQTELGITGTTASEASTTIQGSFNQMKASWENLKIEMTNPEGNVNTALDDFVNSATNFATNVVPAITQTLKGIAGAITALAPIIGQELPGLFTEILPDLISAAVTMVTAVATAITNNGPQIIYGFIQIIKSVGKVLEDSNNPFFKALGKLLNKVADGAQLALDLLEDFPGTVQRLKESDSAGLRALGTVLEAIGAALQWMIDNQEVVIAAVTAIIAAFAVAKIASFVASLNPVTIILGLIAAAATAIATNWEAIKETVIGIWNSIKDAVSSAWDAVSKWWTENISEPVENAWNAVKDKITTVWDNIKRYADDVWTAVKGLWQENIAKPVSEAWEEVKKGITDVWDALKTAAETAWNAIKDFVTNAITSARATLVDLWNRIKEKATNVWNGLKSAAETAWNAIKSFIQNPIGAVRATLTDLWNRIKEKATSVWNTVKDKASSIWEAIKGVIQKPIIAVRATLADIWKRIKDKAVSTWNAISATVSPVIEGIKSVIDGVANAVKAVIEWFEKLMGYDGKNLASTTSEHTHTTTTVEKIRRVYDNAPEPTEENPYPLVTQQIDPVTLAPIPQTAKGAWNVPYDNYLTMLHRGEAVLTASQARKFRDGDQESGGFDISVLTGAIVDAIKNGMANAQVNSFLDGQAVTDVVSRIQGSNLNARRFA